MIAGRKLTGLLPVLRGALAGVVAAAVALGIAELMAAVIGPLSGPVVAVGSAAIDLTPVPVKDFAIAHFGTHDKSALLTGILVVLVVLAAAAGAVAVRRLAAGLAGLVVVGALGLVAALTRPAAGPDDALPTLAGIAAAAVVLTVLVRRAGGSRPRPARAGVAAAPAPATAMRGTGRDPRPGPARRGFLAAAGAAAVLAGASGAAGDLLLRRFSVAAARSAIRLPRPAAPAPGVPPDAELNVSGLTPFFTPNPGFYRVDTDLTVPQVSPQEWTLRITGMVENPLELTFDDLLRLPLIEHDMTLVCVSNQVGGPYAGNARWLGASLPALLRRAGIRRGANQVLSSAIDGMTISTPVDTIMDGRRALVAIGMNHQPLPLEHGFPARMVVPGLYGYVSATKWLTVLEVTTFARERAYWTQRGYSQRAPIKTQSRIDIPRPLARLAPGRVVVAGVAWAPHRGISAVQVNVDGGPWHDARLAAADGIDTWRQWTWSWEATAGLHSLQVRAADGSGVFQTSERAGVFPSGATGWDSVVVTVG